MRKMLIIGATSAIAEATARLFAADGDALFLVARDRRRLDALAADLKVRGAAAVHTLEMDANACDRHEAMLQDATERLGGLDTMLIAYGTLSDQAACEQSAELTLAELKTNALSVISIVTGAANRFERQGGGTIAVISSVAGDRGRKSNYVYGTAKAAVSTFLEGLRHRLHRAGVHVLTIKPGLVDTPMTSAFPKGRLWSDPARVARDIHRAIERRRDVCYTPFFWWGIMRVIVLMPRWLFKRTNL